MLLAALIAFALAFIFAYWRITARLDRNMALLDALTAQVAATTTVEQSAVTLIQGIAAQLSAAAGDPVAVQALADQLKAATDPLAAAIAASTPAAPPSAS